MYVVRGEGAGWEERVEMTLNGLEVDGGDQGSGLGCGGGEVRYIGNSVLGSLAHFHSWECFPFCNKMTV